MPHFISYSASGGGLFEHGSGPLLHLLHHQFRLRTDWSVRILFLLPVNFFNDSLTQDLHVAFGFVTPCCRGGAYAINVRTSGIKLLLLFRSCLLPESGPDAFKCGRPSLTLATVATRCIVSLGRISASLLVTRGAGLQLGRLHSRTLFNVSCGPFPSRTHN